MSISKLSGVAYSSINKISGVAKSGVAKVKGIVPVYFLDTHAGATCAYSLRQLSSSATVAITVENSSGSTADIGFTAAGGLDTSALATHCGSNFGRVSRWHDQSGNGNHMDQSSATSRPYIVDASGNLITTTNNSVPALNFNFSSTGRHLQNSGFQTNNGDQFLTSYLAEFTSVTAGQNLAMQWTSSTSTQVFANQLLGASSKLRSSARFNDSGKSLGRADTSATVSTGVEYIVTNFMSASPYTGDIDVNGDTSDALTGFPSSGGINNGSQEFALGRRPDNGAGQFTGLMAEFVMWSDSTLPDRSNVLSDMNTHYSVF